MESYAHNFSGLVTKLDYISVIAPYYGYLHQGSIVYKQLSMKARNAWNANKSAVLRVIFNNPQLRNKLTIIPCSGGLENDIKWLMQADNYLYYALEFLNIKDEKNIMALASFLTKYEVINPYGFSKIEIIGNDSILMLANVFAKIYVKKGFNVNSLNIEANSSLLEEYYSNMNVDKRSFEFGNLVCSSINSNNLPRQCHRVLLDCIGDLSKFENITFQVLESNYTNLSGGIRDVDSLNTQYDNSGTNLILTDLPDINLSTDYDQFISPIYNLGQAMNSIRTIEINNVKASSAKCIVNNILNAFNDTDTVKYSSLAHIKQLKLGGPKSYSEFTYNYDLHDAVVIAWKEDIYSAYRIPRIQCKADNNSIDITNNFIVLQNKSYELILDLEPGKILLDINLTDKINELFAENSYTEGKDLKSAFLMVLTSYPTIYNIIKGFIMTNNISTNENTYKIHMLLNEYHDNVYNMIKINPKSKVSLQIGQLSTSKFDKKNKDIISFFRYHYNDMKLNPDSIYSLTIHSGVVEASATTLITQFLKKHTSLRHFEMITKDDSCLYDIFEALEDNKCIESMGFYCPYYSSELIQTVYDFKIGKPYLSLHLNKERGEDFDDEDGAIIFQS